MPIKDHVRRALERAGEDVTITSYEQTGEDEQRDPVFSETTTAATGMFRQPRGEVQEVSTPQGTRSAPDVFIYVSTEHAGVLSGPSADNPRASEITRTATGRTFVVVDVWDEGNGQFRISAIKENQ